MRRAYTMRHNGLGVVVLSAILATVFSQSTNNPYKLNTDKRQWLFQCGGWGPGCMKTPPAKIRLLSKLNYNPVYKHNYSQPGDKFNFFTSGTSWAAIGKRDTNNRGDSFRQLLLYVLLSKTGFMYKEMFYKEMLRRFLKERMKSRLHDIPQLS